MLSKAELQAARGIGIVLVVFGHLLVPTTLFINVYIYHMPLFFFLGGMALRTSPPVSSLARRDGYSLLGYTALHSGILAAITIVLNAGFDLKIVTSSPLDWRTYLLWPITQNSHHVMLFVVGWFLIALFFTRLLSLLVLKALHQHHAAAVAVALVLGWLGFTAISDMYLSSKFWLLNLASQVCVGSMFCILGYMAQNHLRLPARTIQGKWLFGLYAVLVVFSLSLSIQSASMAWSTYPNGFLIHTLAAGMGIFCVLIAAVLVQQNRALALAGAHSKQIMTYHLAIIAAINGLFGFFGYLDPASVTVFTAYNVEVLWPVYVAVAVTVPIALTVAWEQRHRFVQARKLRMGA